MTGEEERICTVDILVHDRRIGWSVAEGGESKTQAAVDMKLPERRKQTIDLLVGLLRHSTDVLQEATDLEKTTDREGQKLYEQLLGVVGHELFDLLFVGPIRDKIASALDSLDQDNGIDRFRIQLCFTGSDAEWLSKLPWEYARTPPDDPDFDSRGVFLAKAAELVLSRRLERKSFRNLKVNRWPVRILLACSSPRDEGSGLDRVEAVRVIERLKELEKEEVVELAELVEPAPPKVRGATYKATVTWGAFQALATKFKPEIVHFIGHGHCANGAGALAFAQDNGEVDWVTDDEFAQVASQLKSLKLVFLQACKSALPDPYVSFSGVARTLAASGMPAVIGMQYRVTASAANEFAVGFYDALLEQGLPISFAVQAGRQKLGAQRGQDRTSFGLPVLYLSTDAKLRRTTVENGGGSGDNPALAVDRGGAAAPLAVVLCPRCRAELEGLEQKVCQQCGLRLICPEPDCGERYSDPVGDRFCRNCRAPVRQDPYVPDDLDAVSSTGGSTAQRRSALAALHGAGSGRP